MVTYSLPSHQPPFAVRLRRRAADIRSWLCVGLDPDLERLPDGTSRDASGVEEFCRAIIAATHDYAAAFKINFAFFEVLGTAGWAALDAVRRAIPDDVPVIADAKRGDIGNTDRAYARAILEVLGFDAVTVSPYLGWDSVAPFLGIPGKAALVLCKTSNPGSADFQDLPVDGVPLYMRVARTAITHAGLDSAPGEVGLVIGATYPDALRSVRALSDGMVFLVPGVGAQGARAADAVAAGANARGENALISVSREVIFASPDKHFAEAAGRAAQSLAAETVRAPTH